MSQARSSRILMVAGILAALGLHSHSVRAAFWEELSDVAFAPELVCQDGIYFGLAASDAYSYDVVATLTSSTSGSDPVIDHERVTLAPGRVSDPSLSGGRSHSGFFVLPWAETLATGTSVTFDFVPVGDAQDSANPEVLVQDCLISPPIYLPLVLKP